MAEAPVVEYVSAETVPPRRSDASMSLRALARTLAARRGVALVILGSLLALCILYCLLAPRQYEAKARLALRMGPANTLSSDASASAGSLASGQVQLETLANVLRSDGLAWRVIVAKRLYAQPAFAGSFAQRYPDFQAGRPSSEAESWLLERFHDRLHVRTIPLTVLLEVRFRCRDAALATQVLDSLIQGFDDEQAESRSSATGAATGWMAQQLAELKAHSDRDEDKLARFQRANGLLIAPEALGDGHAGTVQHGSAATGLDELERDLEAAGAERIAREAQYHAAVEGDPEAELAAEPHGQGDSGAISAAVFRQIHARQGDLEQEQAQLSLEHGPNFPRVLEIRKELDDLQQQLKAEDARVRDSLKAAWQTAADREQMLRRALADRTGASQAQNQAVMQYEQMRREADASHELYIRMREKVQEAGMTGGVPGSPLWVVDAPRADARPVSPDPPLYLAITLFVGIWIAIAAVLAVETIRPSVAHWIVAALVLGMAAAGQAQAPTPSTSGLPTGVARIPGSPEGRAPAGPKDAPPVWNGQKPAGPAGLAANLTGAMPAPIAPGDMLDVSEFHIPEFHSTVRVSETGTVALPLVGEVNVLGLDEGGASQAIAAALISKGMLLHPQVFVLVAAYVGQDVSIMGEVGRPGVYPYGAHHRLLDVISAASGLTPTAGGLVSIMHRDKPDTPELIALADGAAAAMPAHNPELLPGDLVRVSRAGLVYVVGDVLRPGGFAMEPGQRMTVLRALSLAWGPSQNAALKKALLIHEQNGGRTVTELNLARILHGREPDVAVGERDILFVPDSAVKNLWNRTMESVVQSAAGVSIYAGMVYSQRF